MQTRKLDEGTRLIGAISWSSIATGVFLALAIQAVFVQLGLALATSVGDKAPAGGFSLWAVVVQLCAIAIGAAVTARISHAERRMSGVAAGVMTWAVALALGGIAQQGTAMIMRGFDSSGVWAGFLGAVISLAAAIVGGAFGASLGGSAREPGGRIEPMSGQPMARTS